MEQVHVVAYRVDRCGYYRPNHDECDFGALAEAIHGLKEWCSQREIGESSTRIMNDDDGAPEGELLCSDACERDGEYLFEMWQRLSGADGAIASVDSTARVGVGEARDLRVEDGQIPGAPRLFWVLPEQDLVCAVRLRDRATAISEMQRYVRGYLKSFAAPWVVTSRAHEGADLKVAGYRSGPSEPVLPRLPRFMLSKMVDMGLVDLLRARRAEIRAIHYRGRMDVGRARQQLGGINGLLSRFTQVAVPLENPKPFRLDVALPYTPTANELEAIIAEARGMEGTIGPDVGFAIGSESSPRWLRSPSTRMHARLDFGRRNASQVVLTDLLIRLQGQMKSHLELAAREVA